MAAHQLGPLLRPLEGLARLREPLYPDQQSVPDGTHANGSHAVVPKQFPSAWPLTKSSELRRRAEQMRQRFLPDRELVPGDRRVDVLRMPPTVDMTLQLS